MKAFPISVNDYTALEVVEGCDVVIDALDSVNARYALNKACVKKTFHLLQVLQLEHLDKHLQFYQKNLHVIFVCFLN